MAISGLGKKHHSQRGARIGAWRNGFGFKGLLSSRRRLFRLLLITLVFFALLPPLFLHFRLKRLQKIQLKKCGWLNSPPLICAHGGDSTKASPNTIAAYRHAIQSHVDCIEVDVSRSADGVLFALHDSGKGHSNLFGGYFQMLDCPLQLEKLYPCTPRVL